jgi:tetratricopeptide (TPR) repeat protein
MKKSHGIFNLIFFVKSDNSDHSTNLNHSTNNHQKKLNHSELNGKAMVNRSQNNADKAMTYYTRGMTNKQLGKHREAIELYNLAVELDPGMIKAYFNMGISYVYLNEPYKAISNFRKSN